MIWSVILFGPSCAVVLFGLLVALADSIRGH